MLATLMRRFWVWRDGRLLKRHARRVVAAHRAALRDAPLDLIDAIERQRARGAVPPSVTAREAVQARRRDRGAGAVSPVLAAIRPNVRPFSAPSQEPEDRP